jgi:hypothetical protein
MEAREINYHAPDPCMLMASIIYNNDNSLENAVTQLKEILGHAEIICDPMPFDFTHYYTEEMGENLLRVFIEFDEFAHPEQMPFIKNFSSRVERRLGIKGNRTVNIDPGILSRFSLILGSTKKSPHRIYLGRGIWADLTLIYESGIFKELPWTYPDYKSGRIKEILLGMRKRYLKKLNDRRGNS